MKNRDTEKQRRTESAGQNEAMSRRSFLTTAGLAAGTTLMAGTALGLAGCNGDPPSNEPVKEHWDYKADVVVVGFGGAGACAAIEAANAGSSVIILEKNAEKKHFCNTLMAGGIYHSPDPSGNKEDLKKYLLAMFSGENLPTKSEPEHSPLFVKDIVDKFAEYVSDNIEFMKGLDPDYTVLEHAGAAFPEFPGAEGSKYRAFYSGYGGKFTPPNFPTPDMPKEQTRAGLAFFNCLRTGVKERSDLIEVLFESPAKHLIKNEAGEIVGVIAEQAGELKRVKASKAVVLAAGGYEYNEEMRRAFLEGPGIDGWAFYGTPSNEGDGIRMGIEVGAQLTKVGKAASRLIWSCPDIKHNNCSMGMITDSAGGMGTIIVNAKGERFMNETLITKDPSRYFSYKNAVKMDIITLNFPNLPSYMIIDEKKRLAGPITHLGLSTAGFGFIPWDEKNEIPIEKGWLIKANSIKELAEKIRDTHAPNKKRMDPEALTETMRKYKIMAETGVDAEFGRTNRVRDPQTAVVYDAPFEPIEQAPFYALPLVAGGPNTKGGIQTDGNRHVVDWSNKIIPRLYSAGEMSSVFKFVYQGGGNLTECIVCGRIAGINAAEETPWDEKK